MLRTFFAVLLLCAPGLAFGQDVSVRASVSPSTIGVRGETTTLTVEVEQAGGARLRVEPMAPPPADGLVPLRTAPSTQRQTSIVDGRVQQQVSYSWPYRPLREGTATIQPARVKVGDEILATEPITVEVVDTPTQRDERQGGVTDDDLFIRVEPSARRAYVGEQVTLRYLLYFRDGVQIRQSRLADSWDAEGFWREDLEVEQRPFPRVVVEDGTRYQVIPIKRVAVFPTRADDLQVDALEIETEALARRERDPFSSFFMLDRPFELVEIGSPAVTVEVLPLPDGAPPSFTGATGQLSMDVDVDRTTVEVGAPVEVQVTFTGTVNLATLEAPVLDVPPSLEVYDPQTTLDLRRDGRQVRGTKTFTYVLVPQRPGRIEVPAIEAAYFDPRAERYRTLRADPLVLSVEGEAAAPLASASAEELPPRDLAPLATEAGRWVSLDREPLHRRAWPYALAAAPLALAALALLARRRRERLVEDPAEARRRRAHTEAQRHLARARDQLGDARVFYAALERSVLGFIADHTGQTPQALGRERLRTTLAHAPAPLRDDLLALLDRSDAAQYAPVRPDRAAREHDLQHAEDLLARLREHLGQ